jgi:glucose 1-dehydrogenase
MNTKNVIVTGSSRGIGQAVAMEFAKAGYNLVINSRNTDELSASKEEILKAIDGSVEIVTSRGDISQEHVCKRLMDVAEKKLGGLDVLVNKAGINGPEKNTTDISSTEWDKVLDINLKGSFFCSREAIKKMLSQMKRREYSDYSIINISSVHQTTPMPLAVPYAASKGGMEMLTKTMALEVANKGIRINAIAPGAIATMMNIDILEDEKKIEWKGRTYTFNRIGGKII